MSSDKLVDLEHATYKTVIHHSGMITYYNSKQHDFCWQMSVDITGYAEAQHVWQDTKEQGAHYEQKEVLAQCA